MMDDGLEAMYQYEFDKAISLFEKVLVIEPNWERASEHLRDAKEYKAGKVRPPRLPQEISLPLGRTMSMVRAGQLNSARKEMDLILGLVKEKGIPVWNELKDLDKEISDGLIAENLFMEAKRLAKKGDINIAVEKAKKASEFSGKPLYKEFLKNLFQRAQIRIFISYAREDVDVVLELYMRLKAEGFTPWLDIVKILPGEDWRLAIQKEIIDSDVFIACLSSQSVSKHGYIQAELKKAMEVLDEYPEGDIFLIPLRLDDCKVPEKLSHIQYIDYSDSDSFEKLIRAISTKIKV
jgi:hypothetical protein